MTSGRRARPEGNILELLRRIDREDLTLDLADVPEPLTEVLRLALAAAPAARRITMTRIAEQLA